MLRVKQQPKSDYQETLPHNISKCKRTETDMKGPKWG